jgi:hypothetical protein
MIKNEKIAKLRKLSLSHVIGLVLLYVILITDKDEGQ